MNAITYISQLSDVLRPSTSLQDVTQTHCVLPITLDVLRHTFTLHVLLKQMAITVFPLALWSIRELSTYLDTTLTSDFSTIMCHFTVSASSQFSRTERLLDNLLQSDGARPAQDLRGVCPSGEDHSPVACLRQPSAKAAGSTGCLQSDVRGRLP